MDTKLKDSPSPGPDPSKFNYSNYTVPGIDIKMLDQMATAIFDNPNSNFFGTILLFIKLSIAVAYIWARTKLVNIQALIFTQQYQQDQGNNANHNINGDNLDGGLRFP